MDKAYSPHEIERRWYDRWEASGYFAPRPAAGGGERFYCIQLPPPNVTGTLHMGHAFQQTLMDTLIRYHRMRGFTTNWVVGTDHAGIATQIVVERQLQAEGRTRHELGRSAVEARRNFVERVWQWKQQSGSTITRQMRRLGDSANWTYADTEGQHGGYFTMDAKMSRAVAEVFVRLYEEGLIYRGQRLVNWDPVLGTAVSDLEVETEEEDGKIWEVRYPLADGGGSLTVATTRPETMLGDVAVAVHPQDERYQHLVGKQLRLPLTERTIPVIADEYVDREFGTGCVKITPAHDFNDYQVGQRHHLPTIGMLTLEAKVADSAPPPYRGLDRFEARKRIVADLDSQGLLAAEKPYKLRVPRSGRTRVIVEPMLTDQWFVDLTRKQQDDGRPGGWTAVTQPALKAVADGEIEFFPEHWVTTYNHWLENIQDWCISRQLWWGHQIPAWYDTAGNLYVAREEEEARRQAAAKGYDGPLTRDPDVLDTWFSSGLVPFSTLGWPEQTPDLDAYLPSDVLITGNDIIFFWVARMIMMTLHFTGKVPFRHVYINAMVRDAEGQKMSKSKGNTLDPLDLIDGIDLEALVRKSTSGLLLEGQRQKAEKYIRSHYPQGIPSFGTDALRFTFASLAPLSLTLNFDLNRCTGYRNFCNKLWNAARFVLMNTHGQDCSPGGELSIADRWIRSRLAATTAQVHARLAEYRFDLAAQALYEFAWYDYCDWYVELCKPALSSDEANAGQKRATRHTLVAVMEAYLRLLHPLMPFITEEIWQAVAPLAGKTGKTVMLEAYPEAGDFPLDPAAERAIVPIKAAIEGPRQIRAQLNVPPARNIPIYFTAADAEDETTLRANQALVSSVGNISALHFATAATVIPPSATAIVSGRTMRAPLADLIDDPREEIARLEKRKAKTEQDLRKCSAKLANDNFVRNAPAAVVDQERQRVADFTRELAQLDMQLEQLEALR